MTNDGQRIAVARDAWEAAIWADDAPVPDAQRRVLLAYRRWKIAEGTQEFGTQTPGPSTRKRREVLATYLSAHRTMINGSALCTAMAVTERD